MERQSLSVTGSEVLLAISPWFHPLATLEGKKNKNLQKHPEGLAPQLDPNFPHNNRNNQLVALA
jgi:hypothetical protein